MMSNIWPPSPSVEDEAIALAKEHGLEAAIQELKNDVPPADSRGAVDQYPIILDNSSKAAQPLQQEKNTQKPASFPIDGQSSDESSGPATPPPANRDRRYVFIPATQNSPAPATAGNVKPRSKSTTRVESDATARGRPQVSRIQTDLGGDLQGMVTGQRRAPSPYSYKAPTASALTSGLEDKTKASLLSPLTAAAPRPNEGSTRRARSAHPDRTAPNADNSDSDRRAHRRHRSRSRVDRNGVYHSSGEETAHKTKHRPSGTEKSPPREKRSTTSYRTTLENSTLPLTPGVTRESPYTSATEDSDRHRYSATRRPERRSSKDSPYTSSAEESHKRRSGDERSGLRSRRTSSHRNDRPHIDLSGQRRPYIDEKIRERLEEHGHRNGHERSPQSMEEYFERALEDNRRRHNKYTSGHSLNSSPFTSPPTSPPRTPRGERKSRDYFEMTAATNISSKERSRPPSIDETQYKDFKPTTSLLGAATLGASLAKSVPTLSRSSTASLETPSSGSQSKPASGQWSRKPSPVHEEGRIVDTQPAMPRQANPRPVEPRPVDSGPSNSRPVSRAGSLTGREDQLPNRPSIYSSREERPVSRDGAFIPAPHDQIRPLQRAFSYSSSLEGQPLSRPSSSYRAYSTANPSVATPSSHLAPSQGPPLLGRFPHSSPTSSEKVPSLSKFTQPRPILLPMCPTPYPITGSHHWYTIKGLKNFDICSACVATLDTSLFRDFFVPNTYKPHTEAVSCAMGKPWFRIAVVRSLKEGRANINLIKELSHLPPDVFPCPGKKADVRRWYHLKDPSTKRPVSNFDICTACVRAVETVFPELWKEQLFERPEGKLSQERICNLQVGSKHFHAMINELDKLATYSRNKDLRNKDIQAFADFVRKTCRYRECSKDAMLATQAWHFMPELPEFTVCEECFEEVVWPLKDRPIAKDVSKTTRLVPSLRRDQHLPGLSCQLYSERMRTLFRDAVSRNDFEGLRQAAKLRYDMEHRLQEIQRLYEQDQRAGIDRRADMDRNISLWKTYE